VLSHGNADTWNSVNTDGNVILYNGTAYNTWFRGFNGSGDSAIGYASSKDGLKWQVFGKPVLPAAPPWNGAIGGPFEPSVIWNGTRYLMYYTSHSSPLEKDIGLAVSNDLIHWSEYPNNPIIRPGPGAYDSEWVAYPSVVYDPPLYKMWYTGQNRQTLTETVSYATSYDGIHWNKLGGNPVLTSQSTKSLNYHPLPFSHQNRGGVPDSLLRLPAQRGRHPVRLV